MPPPPVLLLQTSAPLLITELAFPTHRAPITSLYNTTWYLGAIVAAWATFGTFSLDNSWSWRIPSGELNTFLRFPSQTFPLSKHVADALSTRTDFYR